MSTAPAVCRPSAIRRWLIRFVVVVAFVVLAAGSFVGWQIYQRFADQRVLQGTIAEKHP
jgi:hypothetical protein